MTAEEVAAHYGVAVRTVMRWQDKGMPKHVQYTGFKREVRYNLAEIEEWRTAQILCA